MLSPAQAFKVLVGHVLGLDTILGHIVIKVLAGLVQGGQGSGAPPRTLRRRHARAAFGHTIRLMRREGWKRLQRLPGNAEPVSCLCFAPHEQFALWSADERHLSLWHTSPQVKPTEACVQTTSRPSKECGQLRGGQLARHSSWLCAID